ncbi:MAG: UbiA-like polyprenyltransferase [Pseudomonadota bacterium]
MIGPLSLWHRLGRLGVVLEMIKFEHTIFALPFAFMGLLLAGRGLPAPRTVLWVLAAMVGARSAAMAFNRLLDATVDARNPRTSNRALPRGLVSPIFVSWFIAASGGLFFLSAWQLNRTCLLLSPAALAVVLFYSYTKRFTAAAHLVLGAALGLAPVGGWLAANESLAPAPLLLGAGVLFWVAGFDILYSLLDVEFDRGEGLHSIPSRLGPERAVWLARLLHLASALLFATVGVAAGLGLVYFVGTGIVAVFLLVQHLLVSPEDLSRLNVSFFTLNGAVSIILLTACALGLAGC